MNIENLTFEVTGADLRVIHSGGGVMIVEGDVKDLQGNNVYVAWGDDSDIVVTAKNPMHKDYDKDYVDYATYSDLGDEYYFGYEYELQSAIIIVDYINDVYEHTDLGKQLFGAEVLDQLVQARTKFTNALTERRKW